MWLDSTVIRQYTFPKDNTIGHMLGFLQGYLNGSLGILASNAIDITKRKVMERRSDGSDLANLEDLESFLSDDEVSEMYNLYRQSNIRPLYSDDS